MMNVIDWLLAGDPAIRRLTETHLLNRYSEPTTAGIIGRYLDLFDAETMMFGGGVYGPKWISTHYTLLELLAMEMPYNHEVYQAAMQTLLQYEWPNQGMMKNQRHQDVCIVGMLVGLSSYGQSKDQKLFEMVDFLLAHSFADGGWNCEWDWKHPRISSVHTTINVLEGLAEFRRWRPNYRPEDLQRATVDAQEMLLKRELYKRKTDGAPIHPQMIEVAYPPRWKYDVLRALAYFAAVGAPYDHRMEAALDLMHRKMKGPFMPKGKTLSGRIHFALEPERFGYFNTLRMLRVLKAYNPKRYQEFIHQDISKILT